MILATLMAAKAFPTRPAIAGAHGLAILGLAAAGSLLAVAADLPRWQDIRSRR